MLLMLEYNDNEYIMNYNDLETRFENSRLLAVYYSIMASEVTSLDIGTWCIWLNKFSIIDD